MQALFIERRAHYDQMLAAYRAATSPKHALSRYTLLLWATRWLNDVLKAKDMPLVEDEPAPWLTPFEAAYQAQQVTTGYLQAPRLAA